MVMAPPGAQIQPIIKTLYSSPIGFTMAGPGIGVWLSLILLIGAIITGICLLKNKSATIVYSAKTAIVLTTIWLLLFLIAFFR